MIQSAVLRGTLVHQALRQAVTLSRADGRAEGLRSDPLHVVFAHLSLQLEEFKRIFRNVCTVLLNRLNLLLQVASLIVASGLTETAVEPVQLVSPEFKHQVVLVEQFLCFLGL